jgi:hypothetical protein
MLKRKNLYNEDDPDPEDVQEQNMIVCTWLNDLGSNLKEFDVSLSFQSYLLLGQNIILQQ